ncbi:PIN domain/Zn-ribbon domain-containing protein [Thermoproteus tenax]|uniref:PIN domain and a Zn-ribbon module n=1 Tax=Thermoproteus tenax (strain ATCC 35583 / DSM 2078 / JCM 9277 / NBRC 100435 / Kra 1) TaxID=768679 RepID=G4RL00_THETK|nr:PIN domain/Zn-ribbon domain-containing protein [Thermoproteus tenax]CCC82245.1 PIN domain and a Zn-ribbon module [Thermoproteus tenax Kra 1]
MSCYVIDSSALFHARDMRIFTGSRLLTTKQVADEVKDPRAQAALELLGIEVVEVDDKRVRPLKLRAPNLSDADLSLLALALDTGCVLLTDDVELAKTARRMGVRAKGFYFVR